MTMTCRRASFLIQLRPLNNLSSGSIDNVAFHFSTGGEFATESSTSTLDTGRSFVLCWVLQHSCYLLIGFGGYIARVSRSHLNLGGI